MRTFLAAKTFIIGLKRTICTMGSVRIFDI